MKHRWFKGVDWDLVQRRQIPPPWAPSMTAEDDTQYYDEYPDSMEVPSPPGPEEQDLFEDF